MANNSGAVVQKRMGFLASIVWGISSVVVTVVLCATALGLYGLDVLDRKTDTVVDFANELVVQFPSLVDNLPPVFSDALSDRRAPEYRENLDLDVRFSQDAYGNVYPVVTLENNGEETISMLSVRVLVSDGDGDIVSERVKWIATPLAIEDEMPGPILPGARRSIRCPRIRSVSKSDLLAEYEISEIRIWEENDVRGKV